MLKEHLHDTIIQDQRHRFAIGCYTANIDKNMLHEDAASVDQVWETPVCGTAAGAAS